MVKKANIPTIFDIDIHTIPERQGIPAHFHYYIRFLYSVAEYELLISNESTNRQWMPFIEIENYNLDESVIRMVEKVVDGA